MDTLATPLTTMALLACAYGTHEKPKQGIKTVNKEVSEIHERQKPKTALARRFFC